MSSKDWLTARAVATLMFLTPDYYIRDGFQALGIFKTTLSFYIQRQPEVVKNLPWTFQEFWVRDFLIASWVEFCPQTKFPHSRMPVECGMANVEGRICSEACLFCVCSNTVTALRGQENASFSPCLLNTACHKLYLPHRCVLFSSVLMPQINVWQDQLARIWYQQESLSKRVVECRSNEKVKN